MQFAIRSLVPALAAALLLACDAELLGPKHPADARTVASHATGTGGLGTSTLSPSRIGVTWLDGVANEVGWEVHRSTTGPVSGFTLRASLPANTTAYTDSTLVSRTEYCYQVRSFRMTGTKKSYAAFSNVGCSTTFAPPPAPSNVNAVPRSSTIIDISWTDNSNNYWDGEQGLRVERAGDSAGPWQIVASLGANSTLYADRDANFEEQQRCYRIVATNPYGESTSNTDCTAAPRAATDISATSLDAQSVDVSWVDASNVEDGYEVQRRVLGGLWEVVANLPANSNRFHDTAIARDAVYEYGVRAKRDGGFSDVSASGTIAAATRIPDAMVLYGANPANSSAATVSWNSESELATEVRVERSTDGRLTWVSAATFVRPSPLHFGDVDLNPEQEVCYRIIARNALGDSPPSNVDCTIPPAAPSNLLVTNVEGGGSIVTWSDNSTIEDGYLVMAYFCIPGGGGCTYTFDFTYPPNTTSVHVGTDQYGRDGYFEGLCAIYDGGYSDCLWWDPSQGMVSLSAKNESRLTDRAAVPRRPPAARGTRAADPRSSARRTP